MEEDLNTRINYCKQCKEKMKGKGELIFWFYEEICKYFLYTGKPFTIDPNEYGFDCSLARYLEKERYIVTTEGEEEILKAKPLGILFDGKEVEICFDEFSHRDREFDF
jgi:hypothetical protein